MRSFYLALLLSVLFCAGCERRIHEAQLDAKPPAIALASVLADERGASIRQSR